MLREWMTNDGDLGAIYVEEKLLVCISPFSHQT